MSGYRRYQVRGGTDFLTINLLERREITGKDRGEGYWNEEQGATHAQTSLGALTRQGACWQNAQAKVYAWK